MVVLTLRTKLKSEPQSNAFGMRGVAAGSGVHLNAQSREPLLKVATGAALEDKNQIEEKKEYTKFQHNSLQSEKDRY